LPRAEIHVTPLQRDDLAAAQARRPAQEHDQIRVGGLHAADEVDDADVRTLEEDVGDLASRTCGVTHTISCGTRFVR
jgi:hypothetical protein